MRMLSPATVVVVTAFLLSNHILRAQMAPKGETVRRVYIAEFRSDTVKDVRLLNSFTEQFETALLNARLYTILNRRNLRSILVESKNEELMGSLDAVPAETRRRIQRYESAEGVIFGDVFDDSESGEVVISVTLETFDAVKRWKRLVQMKRGLVRDHASRERAMLELATYSESAIRSGSTDDSAKNANASGGAQLGMAPGILLSTTELMGSWEGRISHPTARAKSYRARLDIGTVRKGAASGWSEYPEVRCGGTLIYKGLTGATHEFAEMITHGNCRSGMVLLTTHDEELMYSWRSDRGIEATGGLIRTGPKP